MSLPPRLPLTTVLLLGTAVALLPQQALADGPSLLQLSTAPYDTGSPTDVTDDGTVVGEASPTAGGIEPFYWTADGIGHEIPAAGAGTGEASAISADGSTIVGYWRAAGPSPSQAFVYRPGDAALTVLAAGGNESWATAVNADGSTVLGYIVPSGGTTQAVEWQGANWSNMVTLPLFAGSLGNQAVGISDDGSIVVGYATDASLDVHAIYWRNAGTPVALNDASAQSVAAAISGDGSTIVGVDFDTMGVGRALSWSGANYATATDLGNLGGSAAQANAVDRDGGIIVGFSALADGTFRAFRYANGSMQDLNTLLTSAGVDPGSAVLNNATAISPNGKYIAAVDESAKLPYLVYYDDGSRQAALTNQAEQQASVDALARSRQGIAIGSDAYFGVLAGDLDRVEPSNMVGVFGLVGSAVGGARGRIASGNGWTINAGLADGSSEFGDAGIGGGLLAAVSLRYDAGDFAPGSFHPFGEAGASGGLLSGVSLTRSYAGGIGHGTTSGSLAEIHVRAGVSGELLNGDQVTLDAELGENWLTTAAYDEAADASNPFPASIAAGTQSLTVAKLGGSLSHKLSDKVDLTLHAALAQTLGGSSGLAVATTGFGTLTGDAGSASWLEAGAHLSWAVTNNGAIDLYATATTGGNVPTTGHVGAGYHLSF